MIKLNGWHRLWILVSVLWFVLVALFTWAEFPTSVSKDRVISALSKFSRSRIAEPVTEPNTIAQLESKGSALKGQPVPDSDLPDQLRSKGNATIQEYPPVENSRGHVDFIPDIPELDLPDGNKLYLRTTTTVPEIEAVGREYETIRKKYLQADRTDAIKTAFLYWAVPCAVLYALGWAIAWVYRGFKGNLGDSHN